MLWVRIELSDYLLIALLPMEDLFGIDLGRILLDVGLGLLLGEVSSDDVLNAYITLHHLIGFGVLLVFRNHDFAGLSHYLDGVVFRREHDCPYIVSV